MIIMTTIREMMTSPVVTVKAQQTVFDGAKIMTENSLGCLVVVVDDEEPVGIVTERDFVRRVVGEKLPYETEISKIMSKPLITVDGEASIREAARLMMEHRIRRLPVVDGQKLVGIVVISDFLRELSKKSVREQIIDSLIRYSTEFTPPPST